MGYKLCIFAMSNKDWKHQVLIDILVVFFSKAQINKLMCMLNRGFGLI